MNPTDAQNKQPLTGTDWLINVLDRKLKRETGVGYNVQIILELDGPLSETKLRQDLTEFVEAFPILQGIVKRDGNLRPCWMIPRTTEKTKLLPSALTFAETTSKERVLAALSEMVNRPFADERTHLAFYLARHGTTSYVGMVFDHRLFDARGAEGFLALFEEWRGTRDIAAIRKKIAPSAPVRLVRPLRRLNAARTIVGTVNRATPLSARTSAFGDFGDRKTRFHFITLDESESQALERQAFQQAGYLMLSPYLLAVSLQILHETLSRKGRRVPIFAVPAAVDMRRANDLHGSLFFNHVAYLFLAAQARDISDRQALIKSLCRQMYDQTQARVRESLEESGQLLRFFPLNLLACAAGLPLMPFNGKTGTLSFSYLNETPLAASAFMERTVRNVLHAPRVPILPGFGFFFNRCKGRLNLMLSYLPGLLDHDDLAHIAKALKKIAWEQSGRTENLVVRK
jgi:hypothetical protein